MGDSTVYVVRVWRAGRPFRATARAVESEATLVFSDRTALLDYLAPGAPAAPPSAAGVGKRSPPATQPPHRPRRSEP